MPQEVIYCEAVHPTVAQYIVKHGGKVQTERVPPAWMFHKVTCDVTSKVPIGGNNYPIYRYTLSDGATILVQFLPSKGAVPEHADCSWAMLYIYRNKEKAEEDDI